MTSAAPPVRAWRVAVALAAGAASSALVYTGLALALDPAGSHSGLGLGLIAVGALAPLAGVVRAVIKAATAQRRAEAAWLAVAFVMGGAAVGVAGLGMLGVVGP